MISADASKFSVHFSAEVEFGLGAENWGVVGKSQSDGA